MQDSLQGLSLHRGVGVGAVSDVRERIRELFPQLSPAKQAAARFILDYPEDAAFLSAARLAERAGTSESQVIRLAGTLGYKGWPDLQRELQELVKKRLWQGARQRIASAGETMTMADVLKLTYEAELANLSWTFQANAPERFEQAARLILDARQVAIWARRGASHLGRFLQLHLSQALGHWVIPLEHSMPEALQALGPGDVLIAVSYPNYSPLARFAADHVKGVGGRVISITDSLSAPVAQVADVALLARNKGIWFEQPAAGPVWVAQALLSALITIAPKRFEQALDKFQRLAEGYLKAEPTGE